MVAAAKRRSQHTRTVAENSAVVRHGDTHDGDCGPVYIAGQIAGLVLQGGETGMTTRKKVAARYRELKQVPPPERS